MLAFLRGKLKGYSPAALLYTQVEPLVFWVVNGLPSFPGFLLRHLVCKLLFRRLAGFIWIQPRVELVNAHRISCGSNVAINTGSYLNALGGIVLGDYVLIGSNVTISSGQHPIDGEGPEIFQRPAVPLEIVIETGVWIGAGAVIMPGVRLGRGSVIGANAVVTRSTEPFSVNVGVPARKLRSRTGFTNDTGGSAH